MKLRLRSRQVGISFIGLLFVVGVLACLVVLGGPGLPDGGRVPGRSSRPCRRPPTATRWPRSGRSSTRPPRSTTSSPIAGKDLDISKEGDKVVVKFAYNREIHMFGPAYLLLKYAGQSKKTR